MKRLLLAVALATSTMVVSGCGCSTCSSSGVSSCVSDGCCGSTSYNTYWY